MIIVGFDPGIAIVGYGVVEYSGNKFTHIGHGAIRTAAGQPLSLRLFEISTDLVQLIDMYKPDAVSVEELFFNTNLKTGIQVAQGRGIILLECRKAGIPIFEYTPLQVKQAVVGYGRAEKKQVMEMVRLLLGLEKQPKPDDAADALALAICHSHSSGAQGRIVDNSI